MNINVEFEDLRLGDVVTGFVNGHVNVERPDPVPVHDTMTKAEWELALDRCAECSAPYSWSCDDHDGHAWCDKHNHYARATEMVVFTGYAGGQCYAATLVCGCTLLDESADIEAAR